MKVIDKMVITETFMYGLSADIKDPRYIGSPYHGRLHVFHLRGQASIQSAIEVLRVLDNHYRLGPVSIVRRHQSYAIPASYRVYDGERLLIETTIFWDALDMAADRVLPIKAVKLFGPGVRSSTHLTQSELDDLTEDIAQIKYVYCTTPQEVH